MLSLPQLTNDLATRLARAYVSNLAPSNLALRAHLLERLEGPVGSPTALVTHPVIQAKFPYEAAAETLQDLASNLLDPRLIDALDRVDAGSARMPRDLHPYTHQLAAWRAVLRNRKSIVVSSGTGSGKTECFLIPILNDLVARSSREPAVGVEAVFLYPLNALIASQRERLSAWTRPFGGKIKFCLYNGETPDDVKPAEQAACPEQVLSRRLLRQSPPPVLVTNATMLEYMLIRPQDAPVLAHSQGKLKYIVLDEAHTYVGSQAAEIALLLRRVMQAFGVGPSDVQFIATSATINGRQENDLAQFLADLAGQGLTNVQLITGKSVLPALPDPDTASLPSMGDLAAANAPARFSALAHSQPARQLRERIFERPRTLPQLLESLADSPQWQDWTPQRLLEYIDLASSAKLDGSDGDVFLPIRMHVFARTQPGLWACCNRACSGRWPALEEEQAPDWPFGAILFEAAQRCPACRSLVFPLVFCGKCGGEHLEGKRTEVNLQPAVVPNMQVDSEDDAVGDDAEDADDGDGELVAEVATEAQRRLLASPAWVNEGQVDRFDPATGALGGTTGQPVCVVQPESGSLCCARCGSAEGPATKLFWHAFLSTPFALSVTAPTLLDALPAIDDGSHRPAGGRRLIAFTDSRQGTARFAARLQADSETRWLRSFIYQHLLANGPRPSDPKKMVELREALGMPLPESIKGQLRAELAQLESPRGGTSFGDLTNAISGDQEFKWLNDQRRGLATYDIDAAQTAKLLVWREFVRRPARQTSLETLGLVALRYPFLDAVRQVPLAWSQWGGNLAEWKDFLTICVDFVIRANSAVTLAPHYYRWMGAPLRQKQICPPELQPGAGDIRWPIPGYQGKLSRVPALVLRAFRKEDSDATRSDLREIMQAAWEALRSSGFDAGAMVAVDNGRFRIDLEKAELVICTTSWVCPVSRRMLGTVLRGHTPYVPGSSRLPTLATKVEMPRPPAAKGVLIAGGAPAPAGLIQGWLAQSPSVTAARAAGAWTEFSDRIAEGQAYFRVAEHSAQIPRSLLEQVEDRFKKGEQNILSSSTTMEMGIDIGGLSGVAMNNAPPGPANFLQRAGRAGRRGESRAISLTVCRSQPHDLAVFNNPTWPFDTPVFVPEVRFDSERIVQRHVNALCLTSWLLKWLAGKDGSAIRLSCAEFFVPDLDALQMSVALKLVGYLRTPKAETDLGQAVRGLVAGTILDGRPLSTVLTAAADAIQTASGSFLAQWEPQRAQSQVLGALDATMPAAKAALASLMRLEGEYLLAFLVDEQVLPGHGFPTGIVQFNHVTIKELKTAESERGNAEKKHSRRYEGPSRELEVALREYAPGASVVVRGLVYKSRGLMLNWHLPPTLEGNLPELQALRYHVTCAACGHASHPVRMPPECPECGHALVTARRYLVPAGFAVDLIEDPTTDLSQRGYVPMHPPHLYAGNAPLVPAGSPAVLAFRYSPQGVLTTTCAGEKEFGYAVCMRCGRAEAELTSDSRAPVPPAMASHRPLRGGKNRNATGACTGNDESFAVIRHLTLGTKRNTDVLELQIRDVQGKPIRSPGVAWSIAVALRQALTELLGVDTNELGIGVQAASASGRQAIFLYDESAGGAGFCAAALHRIGELFAAAREILNCKAECDRACHHCLISYGTQDFAHLLDRKGALEVLDDAWQQSLGVADEDKMTGAEMSRAWLPIPALATTLASRSSLQSVRIFAHGEAEEVDFADWAARDWVQELRRRSPNVAIAIVLPRRTNERLEWLQNQQLASICELLHVDLHDVAAAPVQGRQSVVLELKQDDRVLTFGTSDPTASRADRNWLAVGDGVQVVATSSNPVAPASRRVAEARKVRKPSIPGIVELHLERTLDGPLSQLADRFWASVLGAQPTALASAPLARVVYADRYLKSPLAIASVAQVIRWLGHHSYTNSATELELRTQCIQSPRDGSGYQFAHDFRDPTIHEQLLGQVAGTCGCQGRVTWMGRDMQHHRVLELHRCDGSRIDIRLDQGFGFLTSTARFPFNDSVAKQFEALSQGSVQVVTQKDFPALAYVVMVWAGR